MFARDQATESVGEHTGNLYGVHPFYLVVENDGKAHGVLFLNSNAQVSLINTIHNVIELFRNTSLVVHFKIIKISKFEKRNLQKPLKIQEVTTGPGPHLVYRTIGGLLDMYFFPGPKPEEVIQQYHALIGKPFMPPFWALGFQVNRNCSENFSVTWQRKAPPKSSYPFI